MRCSICERPIEGDMRSTYRQVTGWVRDRAAGGINALRDRQETGLYAHAECVDREAAGIAPIPGQLEIQV